MPADSLQAAKNGIEKLNILGTHPFGIFSGRVNSNFKVAPVRNIKMQVQQQSGNVFQPQLTAFLPDDPSVRERFSNTTWFFRTFEFIEQQTTPAQIFQFEFDAVLKVYRIDVEFPVSSHSDIQLGLRSFTAVRGSQPWSFFSSDSTIEWFHSNIAGGEDPFGRRFYGLNQVNFEYTDNNGRELVLDRGELLLGGIEATYTYYIPWKKLMAIGIHSNVAIHSSWNTTRFNPSIDVGGSFNLVKKWNLKNDNLLQWALGVSLLKRNLINLDSNNVSLGNNEFVGRAESILEWTDITTNGNYNSLGIIYEIQTSYRNKAERDYYHLKGDFSINAGWHNAYSTLLDNLSSWSLHYTHGRPRIQYFVYVKEDLVVNNAPDLESGIGVRFNLTRQP